MAGLDFLQGANAEYIEQLYEAYCDDPTSVPDQWQVFFAGYETAGGTTASIPTPRAAQSRQADSPTQAEPTLGVFDLIHSYRELGHLIANLDPLGNHETTHPLLDLSEFGFTEADLSRTVSCPSYVGADSSVLRDLVVQLRAAYCGTMAVEYMYIPSKEQRSWLQERIEPTLNTVELTVDERINLFREVARANAFEQFLHSKFIGQKRFSLEGGEALIPLLNELIEYGGERSVEEIVMGMPHRGRLNVMANVMGKPYDLIFSEFDGAFLPNNVQGDGDVKYHLGYARDHHTRSGKRVHVSLMSNPSHLEAIDPIVAGIVHAKQQYLQDWNERSRVLPILLHGDAAFTGQGIVMETLSLSELKPYHNGGTIHIIINNQIGFTTSPSDARFTRYPSDLAKLINAPVFHVNADDPEAALQAARLAMGFRDRFKEDVVIDLVCYRRHGHNELDDPTFTQPVMYQAIREKRPVHQLYADRLVTESVVDPGEIEEAERSIRKALDRALDHARDTAPKQRVFAFGGVWSDMGWAGKDWSADTAVSEFTLRRVMDAATKIPPAFNAHPKVARLMTTRQETLEGEGSVDWATAEMLGFATLLLEGTNVRLSGQDSGRGTFSQRHAVLHDSETDELYVPLNNVGTPQGRFRVIDTMLSEAGVLGFEYGYSSADPRNLVLWEAQYGDFANGAQVIIDQFIASAESKWQRQSGIVLLLPHGHEGQGPEHSSARLERYLQLCAENNMQVVYPTTPAQYFHLLRRQIHRKFRKPLVVMAPKSMLRMKLAVSRKQEFTDASFAPVLADPDSYPAQQIERLLLCTGKVFYDLLVAREERVYEHIAIVRVEQLYPFPEAELGEILARYPNLGDVVWVQEEPENMGAWNFVRHRIANLLAPKQTLGYAGREAAASPASGSYRVHQQEHEQILAEALTKPKAAVEKKAHGR